jgi:hypothetical protein
MAYLGTQPNDVKKNTGLYTPSEILQLTKDGSWGGSLELIEEQTVSSVSAVDFTSIKENKYDVHLLTVNDYNNASDDFPAGIRFSNDNGSSYESGSSAYQVANQSGRAGGTFITFNGTSFDIIELGRAIGNATNEKFNCYVYLYNLGNSSKYSFTSFQSSFFQSAGDYNMTFGGAVYPTAETINAIRLTTSSGNINCTAKLYGVKQI